MVDYIVRPFAGLSLCLLIGAALIYSPYVIAKAREWLQARRAGPAEESAEQAPEESRVESRKSA